MGLFDFMKKKSIPTKNETNSFGESFDKLTEAGELPFGWVYRNKNFVDKINREYSVFLNIWLESKNKSPMQRYSALKSFVLYLEDVEKICISKGECFEFWFYEILASKDYIQMRKDELRELIKTIKEVETP